MGVTLLAACGDSDPTRVIIALQYDDSWGLTELEVDVADTTVTVAPAAMLELLLPDERAEELLSVRVVGFRGQVRYASGATVVTPVQGQATSATVVLARAPCGAWCSEGQTRCFGDAVAICEQRDSDACMEWSEPLPCGEDAPSCSLGVCGASCIQECDEGQVVCDGPGAVRTCGSYDSDDCLEWGPRVECGDGLMCAGGQCVSECADDCTTEGAQRCTSDQVQVCVDLDFDGCLEWGPAIACEQGTSCSGDACSASCTDDCTENECDGLTYRTCGNYDGDSCLDLSGGDSCVPADPCRVGICTSSGCDSTQLVCDDPPAPMCVDADTLRSCADSTTCSGGECDYGCTDTNCPGGCTAGACDAVQGAVVALLAGDGSGTVTSSPAGIACPGDCEQVYAEGTSVTLTAGAGANSEFAGWSGGGCTGTGTCVVTTTDETREVTATFALKQHRLTVSKSGDGGGTVTSSPAGINCGTTCEVSFHHGTSVTLTATQKAGSRFEGWSGGGCTSTGSCTVSMTAATSVTATFERESIERVLTSGYGFTCGIRADDGQAQCWGRNDEGQASPPEGVAFSGLAAGGWHVCGIRAADGYAQCWGGNGDGRGTPPEGVVFASLAAGASHTCGIRADGQTKCWGYDRYGRTSPPEGVVFSSLAAGGAHTCGVQAVDGYARCWGRTYSGESSPPEGVVFASLAAGAEYTCGSRASDGRPHCWGTNVHGEVSAPSEVPFLGLTAKGNYTCGVRAADGYAQCWGNDSSGESSPPEGVVFTRLAAGASHTCGIRASDGTAQCWGSNSYGESTPPAGVVFGVP